jgi:hypothetical protein
VGGIVSIVGESFSRRGLPRAGETLNINSYRRSLQRAHLRKMVGMVLRDSSVPEDAQTLSRQGLTSLRGQLQAP